MMSGPHFEQLRTRLKGLGLGRVGMKKLKNFHKGRVMRKFRTRGVLCENFASGGMLCEFRITHGVMRKFRTCTIHTPFCNFEAHSNGENFWLLRVGNAG